MSVQFRNALTDQYARGQTITGDEFNLPANCVALEVRIRRDTTATDADGVWKDPGYVGVTLLRSSDGKNWVESGYFGTVGGKQTDVDYKGETYEHQYAGIEVPIYRDGWVFKLKVDSPAAQKLPFEIYYHIADKGRPPLAIDPRNSVGFVDGDNTIGTSVTTLQNPNNVAVSGSNKAIYAQITYYNAASRTVSSSKWGGSGGANMTEVQATTINASMRGYDYRMLNSGISAAAKVYVTMSGACTKLALTVWSWNEVDQTTPEDDLTGTRYSTGSRTASVSDTLNTASGGKCIFQACGWVDYGVINWTPLYSPTGSEINTNGDNPAFLSDYYSSTGATQQVGVTGASSYGYGNAYVLGHGLALNEASGGGVGSGAGSSSGSATVSGVGQSLSTQPGSSSGTATVSGVGQSLAISDGSSSGVATVSGVGQAALTGVGSSSGTGTVTGVGESLFTGVGSSSGTGTVLGASQSLSEGVGASSGVGTASGIGQSLAEATGASSGSSDVQGYSSSDVSVGSASGTSTVSGVGQSLYTGVGSASGTSDADAEGIAAVVVTAVGNAAGTSSANAEPYTPSRGGGRAKGRNKKKEEIPDYLQRIMEPVPQPKVRPVEKKKTVVTDKIIPFQKPIPQPVVVTAVAKTESPKELIQALMDSIKVQNEKIEALTKLVEAKDREIERLFEELRESLYEEVVALTVTLH